MKLKPFKKEKLNNKKKLTMIILGSLAFIFLFIAIYQSFAVYNLKLSERVVDSKVGSLYDIRTLAIFINNEPQPGLTDFPSDADFDRIECFSLQIRLTIILLRLLSYFLYFLGMSHPPFLNYNILGYPLLNLSKKMITCLMKNLTAGGVVIPLF